LLNFFDKLSGAANISTAMKDMIVFYQDKARASGEMTTADGNTIVSILLARCAL